MMYDEVSECPTCWGTGEGCADGVHCPTCGGTGEVEPVDEREALEELRADLDW